MDFAARGVVTEPYGAHDDPVGVALSDVGLLFVLVSKDVGEHGSNGPRDEFTVF